MMRRDERAKEDGGGEDEESKRQGSCQQQSSYTLVKSIARRCLPSYTVLVYTDGCGTTLRLACLCPLYLHRAGAGATSVPR